MGKDSFIQAINPRLYQRLNTDVAKEYAELYAKRLAALLLSFILLEIIVAIVGFLVDANKCFPMGATVLVFFLIGAAVIINMSNKEIYRLNSFEYQDTTELEYASARKIKNRTIIALDTLILMVLGPLLILSI